MFKENGKTWLYMLGILIMFGILALMTREFLIPLFRDGKSNAILNPVEERSPAFTINTNFDYIAQVKTNLGTFTIDLFEKNAPQNVNNFIYLTERRYFNQTKFHRLIPNLLIQGGDRNTLDDNPSNDGKGTPGYVVKDEINFQSLNLTDEEIRDRERDGFRTNADVESKALQRYRVAMANDGRDTNGSQFFIIFGRNDDSRINHLNGRHTVIGEIIDGFNVFDRIANTPVDNPDSNIPRPQQDIIIESVVIFTR